MVDRHEEDTFSEPSRRTKIAVRIGVIAWGFLLITLISLILIPSFDNAGSAVSVWLGQLSKASGILSFLFGAAGIVLTILSTLQNERTAWLVASWILYGPLFLLLVFLSTIYFWDTFIAPR
jgi:hypothetical protein